MVFLGSFNEKMRRIGEFDKLADEMIGGLANGGIGNTMRKLATGFACLFFIEKPSP